MACEVGDAALSSPQPVIAPRFSPSTSARRSRLGAEARERAAVLIQRVWRGWWSRRVVVDGVELSFNAICAQIDGDMLSQPWSWPAVASSSTRAIRRAIAAEAHTAMAPEGSSIPSAAERLDNPEMARQETSPVSCCLYTHTGVPVAAPADSDAALSRSSAHGVHALQVRLRTCEPDCSTTPTGPDKVPEVQYCPDSPCATGGILDLPGCSHTIVVGSAPSTPLHCPPDAASSSPHMVGRALVWEKTLLEQQLEQEGPGEQLQQPRPNLRSADSVEESNCATRGGSGTAELLKAGISEAERRTLAEKLESELRWTEAALQSRVQHLIDTKHGDLGNHSTDL